jgi:hypothetical protein
MATISNNKTNKQPKVKAVPKVGKDKHYVNCDDLKKAIEDYYKTDDCTVFLCESINKIAQGLSFSPSFINYSYKEEMIGDAIVKMFSALKRKKYDVNSETSPFSYFTTIAFHAFINRIKKEKKHHDAVTAYRDQKYEELLTSGEANIYIKPTIESDDELGYTDYSE